MPQLATDACRMLKDVIELAHCGPRHPASAGDLASRAYLQAQAAQYGLEAWTVPVPVQAFTPGPASLAVETAPPRTLDCLPQDRSGSSGPAGVRGRVIYAALGRDEDYAGLDVVGAIVLQEIWGLHMTIKVANAHARGAAGCVWIHQHPGGRRSAWGLAAEQSPLPVVSVSYEDGRWLQSVAGTQPVNATLRCSVRTSPATSDHVLLRLASANPSSGPVLLVAHRDTTHVSPGANDNASGCAVALEVLRRMSGINLPFDLVAVFSTAEEGGGIGIRQVASRLAAADYGRPAGCGQLLAPSAAIILDMLSVGGPMRLVTGSATAYTAPGLNSRLREAAADAGYYLEDYLCPMGLADAGPLLEAGIPSTWLFKPDDPRFHTFEDTVEHVNPNDMKVAADIVCGALARMGGLW